MNNPISILKEKKGMTLVETVIAFVIAGILIAATGALIITGLNLFNDTAARSLDKQIGDEVLDVASTNLKYVTGITAKSDVPTETSNGAIFVGTDESAPSDKGYLYMKKANKDEGAFSVFPEDSFYSGRKISLTYAVESTDASKKAITLTVKVYDGETQKYTRSTTIQLLNIPKDAVLSGGDGNVLVYTEL